MKKAEAQRLYDILVAESFSSDKRLEYLRLAVVELLHDRLKDFAPDSEVPQCEKCGGPQEQPRFAISGHGRNIMGWHVHNSMCDAPPTCNPCNDPFHLVPKSQEM